MRSENVSREGGVCYRIDLLPGPIRGGEWRPPGLHSGPPGVLLGCSRDLLGSSWAPPGLQTNKVPPICLLVCSRGALQKRLPVPMYFFSMSRTVPNGTRPNALDVQDRAGKQASEIHLWFLKLRCFVSLGRQRAITTPGPDGMAA